MTQIASHSTDDTVQNKPAQVNVKEFFDEHSKTFSYVVSDPKTRECAIIDSVLDYDAASATTSTTLADQIIDYVEQQQLTVQWILETHVHADHLTAAPYLKKKLGGKIAMSGKIDTVQQTFSAIYQIDLKHINSIQTFDYFFADGEHFMVGEVDAYNIPTPGHTPACLSYVIGDAVFVGDTIFMPDYGTARCDFPKGSASQLYDSIQELYALPDDTRVFLCHDYLPENRDEYQCKTNIATQKSSNIHLNQNVTKEQFVAMRQARDAGLTMPELILPSIQVNMCGGKIPTIEQNQPYLKIPVNMFSDKAKPKD